MDNKSNLEKEIDKLYEEHYKDCNDKSIHDFYHAVIKRVRRDKNNNE